MRNQNIILIPVVILFKSNEIHANVLIYNSKFKSFSLFEPYGTISRIKDAETNLFNFLISEINNHIPSDKRVHYEPSYDICPQYFSMQQLEEESSKLVKHKKSESKGYCVIWSLFFSELVLANPERSVKQLYNDIYYYILQEVGMGNAGDYLRYIARGYVKVVNEKLNKYFNTLYDSNMDMSNYVKIIKNLHRNEYENYMYIFNTYINFMYQLQMTSIDDIYNRYNILKTRPEYMEKLKYKNDRFTIQLNVIEKIRNNELLKNVDLSCCGLSFDGRFLYEDYNNAILHAKSKVFSVNKNAFMYSHKRIDHRRYKLMDRGWKQIENTIENNRDLKIDLLV
jgi:hypothetical protein